MTKRLRRSDWLRSSISICWRKNWRTKFSGNYLVRCEWKKCTTKYNPTKWKIWSEVGSKCRSRLGQNLKFRFLKSWCREMGNRYSKTWNWIAISNFWARNFIVKIWKSQPDFRSGGPTNLNWATSICPSYLFSLPNSFFSLPIKILILN